MRAPDTVKKPSTVLEPIARVPAVIADMSDVETVKVPAPPATVMNLSPLGMRETVPVPASIVPENETSLAVIVMAELVEKVDVETALVTLPVPSVVIVTPVAP